MQVLEAPHSTRPSTSINRIESVRCQIASGWDQDERDARRQEATRKLNQLCDILFSTELASK